ATKISYGAVSDSDVNVTPSASAKVVDPTAPTPQPGAETKAKPVSGLDAVQAAAGFNVVAPDTLVGLPRQDVRLVHKAVVVVYGQGLGAILVVERQADTSGGQSGGPLSRLPKISLDGLTGHELATQPGPGIEWQRKRVGLVLAGSPPPTAARAAARALK